MKIGDTIRTPFGEYGIIISKANYPYHWVIQNAEDDEVEEQYRENDLIVIRTLTSSSSDGKDNVPSDEQEQHRILDKPPE